MSIAASAAGRVLLALLTSFAFLYGVAAPAEASGAASPAGADAHGYEASSTRTTAPATSRAGASLVYDAPLEISGSPASAEPLGRATEGTARARDLGRAGEDAAGIVKNTERIPSLSGACRVPRAGRA